LARRGVNLDHFLQTEQRRTFTYCKPLVVGPGKPPLELNRLDSKNWTPTPTLVQERLIDSIARLSTGVDATVLMDQVDLPETGVVTARVLKAVARLVDEHPRLLFIADSRRGLRGYPPVCFKMNAAELAALTGARNDLTVEQVKQTAASLAQRHQRNVFVTLAERGIVGAPPRAEPSHVSALPLRGEIDIVGAGDAVTANLVAALAAGATVKESCEIAMAAASIVIHQLGTTGTASAAEIESLLAR